MEPGLLTVEQTPVELAQTFSDVGSALLDDDNGEATLIEPSAEE